jgi:hypothetical protein
LRRFHPDCGNRGSNLARRNFEYASVLAGFVRRSNYSNPATNPAKFPKAPN